MLGYILKFIIMVTIVMIGLNIFVPQRVEEILSSVSKTINIEQTTLQNNLDKATHFVQDTAQEVTDKVKKNLDQ